MSVVSQTFHMATCDACGGDAVDYETGWDRSPAGALQDAAEAEAIVVGDFVVCVDCVSAYEDVVSAVEFNRLVGHDPAAPNPFRAGGFGAWREPDPLAQFALKGWARRRLAVSVSERSDDAA